MKTKTVPLLITLSAASVSCAISLIQQTDFRTFVGRLFLTVLIFFVIGYIAKAILDRVFTDKGKNEPVNSEKEAASSGDGEEDEEKAGSDES